MCSQNLKTKQNRVGPSQIGIASVQWSEQDRGLGSRAGPILTTVVVVWLSPDRARTSPKPRSSPHKSVTNLGWTIPGPSRKVLRLGQYKLEHKTGLRKKI